MKGGGTEHPFEIFGHPKLPDTLTAFTPISRPGGASEPKLKDQRCYGWDLSTQKQPHPSRIELKWLLRAYQLFADKDDFYKTKKFNGGATDYYFNKLSQATALMQQIQQGVTEEAIKEKAGNQRWTPFKLVRRNIFCILILINQSMESSINSLSVSIKNAVNTSQMY